MEFRMGCEHLQKSDFAEGVRARIIEKDNQPNWMYKRVEDVPQPVVESFFQSLPDDKELKL